jgi:predicted HNH restriction endonuclease
MMAVRRSEKMWLVAYALSRCGAKSASGKPAAPPSWLKVRSWSEAYAAFYPVLHEGRTERAFSNSLKNARDSFDAHLNNGRVGWVSKIGLPHRQDGIVRRILSEWSGKGDDELRQAIEDILQGDTRPSDAEDEAQARTEGGIQVKLVKRKERDPSLRRDAIEIHGIVCQGCGFDFEATYGILGRGYIEVHHSMPLAAFGVRKTDPASDLAVLCANCHRMVHRQRDVCLSLDELKAILLSPVTS